MSFQGDDRAAAEALGAASARVKYDMQTIEKPFFRLHSERTMTEESILLGRSNQIMEFPQAAWKAELSHVPQHSQSRLSFMAPAHHQVRYFVVKELANRQQPIEAASISEQVNIPLEQVSSILDELEQKLFFLVRNERGAVAWAFPVTVEPTPHKLYFASGERLYGA